MMIVIYLNTILIELLEDQQHKKNTQYDKQQNQYENIL